MIDLGEDDCANQNLSARVFAPRPSRFDPSPTCFTFLLSRLELAQPLIEILDRLRADFESLMVQEMLKGQSDAAKGTP